MNKLIPIIAGALLPLGVVMVVIGLLSRPIAPHSPPNHGGPDLLSIYRANKERGEAKQDALKFAAICDGAARSLKYEFASTSEPLIITGTQLAIFRNKLRENVMDGQRFSAKYPGFADVLESFIDANGSKNGGPFKDGEKEKWIDVFRKLSAASEYAAGRL